MSTPSTVLIRAATIMTTTTTMMASTSCEAIRSAEVQIESTLATTSSRITGSAKNLSTVENEKDCRHTSDETNQLNIEVAMDDDYMISISESLPSLQQCYDFVAEDPCCGAVSTFIGITRNNFQSKKVLSLSYEAYLPMAMKELRNLCTECKMNKYTSIRRIAAVHIIGDCPVGHASVILACSSPHRSDAIQCCDYLINQLKTRIPIWKKEIYVNEPNAVWKENIEWFHQQPQEDQNSNNINAATIEPMTHHQQQPPQPSTDETQLHSHFRRIMVRQRDDDDDNNIDRLP